MISVSDLVGKAKSLFKRQKNKVSVLCDHEFAENGQHWQYLGTVNGKRRFQLKNKFTCISCKTPRLENIGE